MQELLPWLLADRRYAFFAQRLRQERHDFLARGSAGDPREGSLPPGGDVLRGVDVLLRNGLNEVAKARADAVILRDGVGLSRSDCRLLR